MKYFLFLFFTFFLTESICIAQSCNGSLGEPIVNITFGQGLNPGGTLSTVVPGASTSYTYVAPTGSPASNIVFDGNYAIINSVPSNPFWLQTGDHTNNGNGYMAFFNAAPNPGRFYQQTVTGLCAGTTYEFGAWILNVLNDDLLPGSVPPNVTFQIFEPTNLTTPLVSFSTGNIAPTNTVNWQRYSTLFTVPAGINSVILILSNNNIGGISFQGNDLAIDDITFSACGPLTTASFSGTTSVSSLTICSNTAYTIYGTASAGLNTPAYQWQVSTNNGNSWSDIIGATALNYTVPGQPIGTYLYRLVSQESANIGSLFCKFYSNIIQADVIVCGGQNISNIINAYTPVLAFNPCNNSLTVENANAYFAGDTVLMIQMKGAEINESNNASFGSIIDYHNAGNYEFNIIKAKTGNLIELKYRITRQYDIPNGKVQLIRVPYYASPIVTGTLTCLPWDGNKGGVLVLNARDTITLNAKINVSGKGFLGGAGFNSSNPVLNCFENEYIYSSTSQVIAGLKGESIASLASSVIRGKGAPASGGGGGLGHNSGGGGGANAGSGGFGGYQLDNCGSSPFDNRGVGGRALVYSSATNKIFLGGGGGAGNADNPNNYNPTGGNGGGIIIINANFLNSNGNLIEANGDNGIACTIPANPDCHDGMPGGGGGGSVLLNVNQFIGNSIVQKKGGNGANMTSSVSTVGRIGPGGGGGGGLLFIKSPSLPGSINSINAGGINGFLTLDGNNPYGATSGTTGLNLFNLIIPIDTVLFKPNIDSVRIQNNATSCTSFDFNGLAYTNTSAIVQWNWNFGDGNYAYTQNTSHNYSGNGPYVVQLLVTDINGCKDSVTINVSLNPLNINAGIDTSFCSNGTITHVLNGNTNGTGYTWSPAGFLNNNNLQNPTATVSSTTMFYLTTSGVSGCTAIDSVLITVNPVPNVSTINDFSICKLDSILLNTSGNATSYQWNPPLSVNNPVISSPYFTDTVSQQLIVTGTNSSTGCFKKDTINVTIKSLPVIHTIADSAICGARNITLTTMGGQTYSWLPTSDLSNPGISNPIFIGTNTQTYTVTGTGTNGCKAKDTVTITVNVQPVVSTINDISICRGDSLQLITTTDANNNQWIPALSVNNSSIANPYFQDTVSQQMIITGTNVTGCLAKDTVNVTVKPLPVVLSIPDSSLCGAQNITLTTTGALTYSWLPSIGLSNAGIASPVFNGNNTQTYTVTGTGANSCKAKDSVTITINSVPIVTTISNTSICRGDSILLTSNSNAQVNQWSPATSVSNPGTANPYFIDTISQTITLTGTNTSTGCFASTNVNITVKPTPNVVSISDFTSCATNTVTLTTTGAQSYSWSPTANLDDPTISSPVFLGPTGTYTYFVTGTAANGCTAKDIVNITIANKPVFNAPENKTICENEAVQLDGNNGITYGYLWSPATNLNNPGIVNPIANPSLTTPYTLVISDSTCNYDSTFRVLVTVNSLPIINATKSNDLNCSTPESKLTASGAINYNWFPSEGLSNNTINNPIASPSYTTQYVVIGTDNNGCKNSDTITVYRKGGKYFGFNIPNSFTPNGDGLNDCFGVTYWGETKNFQLIVYSRWGEKIFETHNISECWDGIYKGNPAETGSYVFLIKGETLCGKVNRKGNILLIR
jgi:gliding motility-associated-like protein